MGSAEFGVPPSGGQFPEILKGHLTVERGEDLSEVGNAEFGVPPSGGQFPEILKGHRTAERGEDLSTALWAGAGIRINE